MVVTVAEDTIRFIEDRKLKIRGGCVNQGTTYDIFESFCVNGHTQEELQHMVFAAAEVVAAERLAGTVFILQKFVPFPEGMINCFSYPDNPRMEQLMDATHQQRSYEDYIGCVPAEKRDEYLEHWKSH